MQSWEYCTIEYSAAHDETLKIRFNGRELTEQKGKSWADYLNKLGKEGWEMTGTTGSNVFWTLYFKRPIQS